MAPVCSNCGGTDFVWANDLKTGSLGGGSLSLRSRGELSLGTRICRACGHADLFLKDPSILRMPHTWRPGEFTPIVPRTSPAPIHPPPPAPVAPAAPPVAVPAPAPMPSAAPPAAAPPAAPAPPPSPPAAPVPEVPPTAPSQPEPEATPAAPAPAKKSTRRRSAKSKGGGDSSS